jgi:hypothetical protein
MSQNLDYCDLWHELYDLLLEAAEKTRQFDLIISLMEQMDPRLVEEKEMVQQVAEAVKTFLKP